MSKKVRIEDTVDWDLEVGRWLKDVPYMWMKAPLAITKKENRKEWRAYQRVYIIDGVALTTTNGFVPVRGHGAMRIFIIKKKCGMDVIRYFQAVTHVDVHRSAKIRVNGYPIHLPGRYLSRERYLQPSGLYDYLGLKPLTATQTRDWENTLLVKSDDPRPPPPVLEIEVPLPSTSTPAPRRGVKPKGIQLKRAPSREIHLMFWYLRHIGKYPGVCMPLSSRGFDNMVNIQKSYSITIFIEKVDFSEIDLPEWAVQTDFSQITKLCMKSPTIERIFIPISWQYQWKQSAHANFLLIDKTVTNPDGTKNVYIFDPWGETEHAKTIEILPGIMNWLVIGANQGYKWKYHASATWCPNMSFQRLESRIGADAKRIGDYGGFCAVWSMWVLETLLKNPGKPYDVLVRSALNKASKITPDFRRFIRRYAHTIEEYGDEMRRKLNIEFRTPSKAARKAPGASQEIKKGVFSGSDLVKFQKHVKSIRDESVSDLKRKRKESILSSGPTAEGVKWLAAGDYYTVFGDISDALKDKMATAYEFTVRGRGNPFKTKTPSKEYTLPYVEKYKWKEFKELFPKMEELHDTVFPDTKLWYREKSKSSLEICGSPTATEGIVLRSLGLTYMKMRKCYRFYLRQLPAIEKHFPGIQKR